MEYCILLLLLLIVLALIILIQLISVSSQLKSVNTKLNKQASNTVYSCRDVKAIMDKLNRLEAKNKMLENQVQKVNHKIVNYKSLL